MRKVILYQDESNGVYDEDGGYIGAASNKAPDAPEEKDQALELAKLGYSADDLVALKRQGII